MKIHNTVKMNMMLISSSQVITTCKFSKSCCDAVFDAVTRVINEHGCYPLADGDDARVGTINRVWKNGPHVIAEVEIDRFDSRIGYKLGAYGNTNNAREVKIDRIPLGMREKNQDTRYFIIDSLYNIVVKLRCSQ